VATLIIVIPTLVITITILIVNVTATLTETVSKVFAEEYKFFKDGGEEESLEVRLERGGVPEDEVSDEVAVVRMPIWVASFAFSNPQLWQGTFEVSVAQTKHQVTLELRSDLLEQYVQSRLGQSPTIAAVVGKWLTWFKAPNATTVSTGLLEVKEFLLAFTGDTPTKSCACGNNSGLARFESGHNLCVDRAKPLVVVAINHGGVGESKQKKTRRAPPTASSKEVDAESSSSSGSDDDSSDDEPSSKSKSGGEGGHSGSDLDEVAIENASTGAKKASEENNAAMDDDASTGSGSGKRAWIEVLRENLAQKFQGAASEPTELEYKDLQNVGWKHKKPGSNSLQSGFFFYPPSIKSKDIPENTELGIDYFSTKEECILHAKQKLSE